MKKISDIFLFVVAIGVNLLVAAAWTNPDDYTPLLALKSGWRNVPANWVGSDPCGSGWYGITCSNDRIVSITLASVNIGGSLTSDIAEFSELQILDLSYNPNLSGALPDSIGSLSNLIRLILIGCGFSGPIPNQIGQLQKLVTLSLNKNYFSGGIPPSIGLLPNLYWLDLADNKLTGSIPVSNSQEPGLDWLVKAKHFHLGNNQLSGQLPPELFPNLVLIHLILENNQLTGTIPWTLGLVQHLEVLRLDQNLFTGHVPENLNNLTGLQELYLSNNRLDGPFPNLTGMNVLSYVDLSNNSFESTYIPPWLSSSEMQSLTTIFSENTHLEGELPEELFSLNRLQTVSMKNNNINGTLNLGPNPSTQLRLIDLQNNSINAIVRRTDTGVQIILAENPVCSGATENYCTQHLNSEPPYSTPRENCTPFPCPSSRMVSSPKCICAYPYTGTLFFRAPSFSDLGNSTLFVSLQSKMIGVFQNNSLPVDSVSLSKPTISVNRYLRLDLEIFPSGQEYFNQSGISMVGFMLSNQTFKPPKEFGPYFFIGNGYTHFPGSQTAPRGSVNGVVIGAAVGGTVLFLLLLLVGVYAIYHKRKHEAASRKSDPFASWDSHSNSGGVPQIQGAKSFLLDELRQATNYFSEMNVIGSGGYGKVYRGLLPNGQLVAIKRAQQGSVQGVLEFKTEIELLSRVHHKNVISLVGFCFEQREQMLVYEYAVNGCLKDSLSGKSGIRLDWARRLKISLGAAKGIQYLHDLVNPPIVHRDIKSQNIMLDERLVAKVSDFGLSRILLDPDKDHVTTNVKGTMGYLDPEYYMTQQLNEKSDVYSFGVLLLEILTSRPPIQKGKYIVREVRETIDKTKSLYNLQELLDPVVAFAVSSTSVEMFVDLAMKCVQETGIDRPSMSSVVKEIESIMEEAGLNPNFDSASTSASHLSGSSARSPYHPYANESIIAYSETYPLSNLNRVD